MGSKAEANRAAKELYAEWLRLPNKAAREAAGFPTTKKDFAERYNVERTTLWHWEQDPEFRRQVHNDVLGALNIDEVERIKWALKVKAFDGNVPAAKVLLEWAGLYGRYATSPLPPEGPSTEVFEKMSEEELLAFIASEDAEDEDESD